jgi:hypothetical protein
MKSRVRLLACLLSCKSAADFTRLAAMHAKCSSTEQSKIIPPLSQQFTLAPFHMPNQQEQLWAAQPAVGVTCVSAQTRGQRFLTSQRLQDAYLLGFSELSCAVQSARRFGLQVWDFDDDNRLLDSTEPWVPRRQVYSVQTDSCLAFNPYLLMGAPVQHPSAWPRGLPLHLIKQPCQHNLVPASHQTNASIAVVQSLANHEPDVDGIFRLTRTIPFDFESTSQHTLVIPHGTLTPYNAQATLVLKPALWSLLLPVTVGGQQACPFSKQMLAQDRIARVERVWPASNLKSNSVMRLATATVETSSDYC